MGLGAKMVVSRGMLSQDTYGSSPLARTRGLKGEYFMIPQIPHRKGMKISHGSTFIKGCQANGLLGFIPKSITLLLSYILKHTTTHYWNSVAQFLVRFGSGRSVRRFTDYFRFTQ